jgi:negative regulator of flagellin synthesis FlgM
MTDAIYNQPRIPMTNTALKSVIDSSGSASSKKDGASVSASVSGSSAGADTVRLSNVAEQIAAQPGFDQNKVNAIKQALQNGTYAVDPRRIATGFAALEKMIQG